MEELLPLLRIFNCYSNNIIAFSVGVILREIAYTDVIKRHEDKFWSQRLATFV